MREKLNYRRKPTNCKRGKQQRTEPYKLKSLQMPTSMLMQEAAAASSGEDQASHDKHVKLLKQECKKVNPNKATCKELMKRTYPIRRPLITKQPYGLTVDHILSEYPAFRFPEEV